MGWHLSSPGCAGACNDSYAGWDCTGAFLLAYAMPLKKIYLTGKRSASIPQLDAAEAQAVILDGRGWNNKDRNTFYDSLSDEQLIERLQNWSPSSASAPPWPSAVAKTPTSRP